MQLFSTLHYFSLLENVFYDEITHEVEFSDSSKTENTRVSYPIDHIENSVFSSGKPSIGLHPETIIFLTLPTKLGSTCS